MSEHDKPDRRPYSLIVTKAYGRDGPSSRFETYAVPTECLPTELERIADRHLSGRELTRGEKLEMQKADRFVNPDSLMFDQMPVRIERRYGGLAHTVATELGVEICRLNLNADGLGRFNTYLKKADTLLEDLDGVAAAKVDVVDLCLNLYHNSKNSGGYKGQVTSLFRYLTRKRT